MKVAIYCRVSTEDQRKALDIQLNDLKAYAALRQWTVHKEYVDVISGTKQSRPQLNTLMDAARKRQIDAVLVWKFDRFGRSTGHLIRALEEFRTLGIQFISFKENLDTGTPMGKAMFTMVAAMAEFERSLIVERVRAGIKNAKDKGIKLGRKSKGYLRDRAIALKNKGMSQRNIAKELQCSVGLVNKLLKFNNAA